MYVILYNKYDKRLTRLHRIAKSVLKLGIDNKVTICSMSRIVENNNMEGIYLKSFYIWNYSESKLIKLLNFIYFYFRFWIFSLSSSDIKVVAPHSISMLPLAVWVKLFKKKLKLIYSPHELETEKSGMYGIRKVWSSWIEKRSIPSCDKIVVVGDKIKQWYADRYGISDIVVFRNIPSYSIISPWSKSLYFRERFNIAEEDIVYVALGHIEKSRSVELLLDVFSELPSNYHIVFMGHGSLVSLVEKFEENNTNIHFKESVIGNEILRWTSSGDIGIFVLDAKCLSHKYCVPNKLFEFTCSGLPVMFNDLPELKKVAIEYGCGWIVDIDKEKLKEKILSIKKEDLEQKKGAVEVFQRINLWESEEKKLIPIKLMLDT